MRHEFRPLADESAGALRDGQIALAESVIGRRLRAGELPLVRICRRTGAVRVLGVRRTVEVLAQHRPDVLFASADRPPTVDRGADAAGGSPGHGRPACPHGPPARLRKGGAR